MATATITPIATPRPRNLLDDCQRAASTRLPAALQDVLTQADDVLFKLANSADSSKRQDMYFDAMRELRMKQVEIEQRFRDHFGTLAGEKIASASKSPARGTGLEFGGELSLVSLDEVEEDLAVANLATGVRSRCGRDLSALEARLAAALKPPITEVKSFRRLGSGPLPAGPDGRARKIVYYNAILKLTQDVDFASWNGLNASACVCGLR